MIRAGIKSDHTRDPYYYYVNYAKNDKLVAAAKKNPSQIEKKVLSFILLQKKRVSDKEIAGSTVSNFLNAIKLLLEMNDATSLNWKKIKRFLPSAEQNSNNRRSQRDT